MFLLPFVTKYRSDADLYLSSDSTDQRTPLKLATVCVYCGPCPYLINPACDICSSMHKSVHLDFAVRVDPRLSINCCASSATGVYRLKALQAACHHFIRSCSYMNSRISTLDGSIKSDFLLKPRNNMCSVRQILCKARGR